VISKLVIRGFQRHRKLTLDLSPGITTIVGPSDSGKSSILRALRWLLLNETPRGRVVHWDLSKVSVELWVDGRRIRRVRGKKNSYYLDGRKYSAFGRAVPKEIAELLNVSSLNFQDQHERAFWFTLSAGEVSKQLNSIVDLQVVDSTLSNLSSMLRKNRTTQEVVRERVEEAEQTQKRLARAEEAHQALLKLEKDHERLQQLESQVEELEKLQAQLEELSQAGKELGRVESLAQRVAELDDRRDSLSKLGARVKRLESLVGEMGRRLEEQKSLQSELTELLGEIQGYRGSICPSCGQEVVSVEALCG
jgi:exonuclease SbcC